MRTSANERVRDFQRVSFGGRRAGTGGVGRSGADVSRSSGSNASSKRTDNRSPGDGGRRADHGSPNASGRRASGSGAVRSGSNASSKRTDNRRPGADTNRADNGSSNAGRRRASGGSACNSVARLEQTLDRAARRESGGD
jgi:hypothetical protein